MSLKELLGEDFMDELEQKHNPIGVPECVMDSMVFDSTKRLFEVAPEMMEKNAFSLEDISNHIKEHFCL